MANSRRFGHQTRSQRRRSGWGAGPESTTLTISSGTPVLWTSGAAPTSDGLTIARIRGSFGLHLTSAATSGDGFGHIAFGIGIVSLAAFNAGVASVPTPLTEMAWEGWMYHETVSGVISLDTTPLELGNAGSSVRNGKIDSKAMRKIGADEIVFGAIEADDEVGASSFKFWAITRMLSLLP